MKQITITTFDTETGGLPDRGCQNGLLQPEAWPQLLSVAAITRHFSVGVGGVLIPGIVTETNNFIVLPKDYSKITIKALQVNGMSQDFIAAYGKPFGAISVLIEQLLATDYVVAHNANFDINVLIANMQMHGFHCEDLHNVLYKKSVCSAEMTRTYCAIEKPELYDNAERNDSSATNLKRPSLKELWAKVFEMNLEQSHDAIDDTLVLDRIMTRLIRQSLITEDTLKQFTLERLSLVS